MSNKKSKIETSVANLIKPKKNYSYECHCIRCCGKKVDPRTQEKHTIDERLWKSEDYRKNQENTVMARKKKSTNLVSNIPPKTISNESKKRKRDDADSNSPNREDILPDESLPNSFFDFFREEESIHTPLSSKFRIPADDNHPDKEYYIYQDKDDD